MRAYIKAGWTTLTRSTANLPEAARDPKLRLAPGQPFPVYLSAREDRERVARELRQGLGPERFATIDLRVLPADRGAIREHGLLYLPRPYVVPGGRFNEMYGWDSYFIQVGLLRDGELERARDMVDNFLYEVEHYGTILNANRTYYLTRSQPPFLTRMVLGVFDEDAGPGLAARDAARHRGLLPVLDRGAAPACPGSASSRYYDNGDGPGRRRS